MMQVYPHGSTDSLPYCTMGSGSLNAMAVFEDGFQEDMGVEDAKKLVARAIRSGIYNDLGSGSNVDLCIIYKDKVSQICRSLLCIPRPLLICSTSGSCASCHAHAQACQPDGTCSCASCMPSSLTVSCEMGHG